MHRARRHRQRVRFGVPLCALLLAVAGCGGSDSEDKPAAAATAATATATGGVAEAKKLVGELRAPVGWKDPGPAVDAAAIKGKSFYIIGNAISSPYSQELFGGIKEAAKVVGFDVTIVDGAGSSAKASSLIDQAIGRKADIIGLEAWPSTQLTAAIKKAKSAGIPVIAFADHEPAEPTAEELELGLVGQVSPCIACAGKAIADAAVAYSEGKLNSVLFDVPGVGVSVIERKAIEDEITRLCPDDCKVKAVDAPVAQWATGLPTLTSSVLKQDPKLNYLLPLYDTLVNFMKAPIHAANRQDDVGIISLNATLAQMKDLKNSDIVVGLIGNPVAWSGWAFIDQAVRIAGGQKAVADEFIPQRLFDETNINDIDLTKPAESWYSDVDFRAKYKTLWGLQ
jgi:ribose transport system substrate-binding protein